jgi:hypothetical protein
MSVSELDDTAVLAALQEITSEIREELPADQQEAVSSQEDALLALAAVLDSESAASLAERFSLAPEEAIASCRELLAAAVTDPGTAGPATRLVASPPSEDQMAVLGGLEVVILLAALVTFLQTKAKVRVDRKDGKVSYRIEVEKQAAQGPLVEEVIRIARKLFGG